MEQAIESFDNFINSNIKSDNPYIIATLCTFLIIYSGMYAPRLPDFLMKLLTYPITKIFLLFLIVYVNCRCSPFVSIVVAIAMVVLMYVLRNLEGTESFASIMDGFPLMSTPKSYISTSPCDIHGPRNSSHDPNINNLVSSMTDMELESLCNHPKGEIMTESDFSELRNKGEACKFASHQYRLD